MMTSNFGRFYHGKKVFITGHTGFKGSWLSLWLSELGAEVIGFSNSPSQAWPANYQPPGDDVCGRSALLAAIHFTAPDIVFHLAAQPLVSVSYDQPLATLTTNIIGTANLLDTLKQLEFKGRILIVTSDKVYDSHSLPFPHEETDRLGGKKHDPYSLSKAAAEFVAEAYRSFNLDIVSLRAGNVIGGGDWATNRIIPDCVRSLSNLSPVITRSHKSTRPFQYVLDCLSGYLMAGCVNHCPPALNFGPPGSHTVEELVVLFLKAWGSGSWSYGPDSSFHEAPSLQLSSELASNILKWSPILSFEESVRETASWYLKTHTGGDPRTEALDSLCRYCDLATSRNATWTQHWLDDLTP